MAGKRSKPPAKKQVNLAVRIHFCLPPALSDTFQDYAPGPSDARWNPAKDPATVFVSDLRCAKTHRLTALSGMRTEEATLP